MVTKKTKHTCWTCRVVGEGEEVAVPKMVRVLLRLPAGWWANNSAVYCAVCAERMVNGV